MTPNNDPHAILETLVQRTRQAGLVQPARIVLDILRPLDIVCSQCALLVQPFMRGTAWEQQLAVLGESHAWHHLRTRLEQVAETAEAQQPPH